MKAPRHSFSDQRLQLAADFHGHLGPYLVLGLKAGDYLDRVLGKDPFLTSAEIHCSPKPPQSCIVDGVQLTTGCTMGKGNIKIVPGVGIPKIIFIKKERKLELKIKESVYEKIKLLKEDDVETFGEELFTKDCELLFDLSFS